MGLWKDPLGVPGVPLCRGGCGGHSIAIHISRANKAATAAAAATAVLAAAAAAAADPELYGFLEPEESPASSGSSEFLDFLNP